MIAGITAQVIEGLGVVQDISVSLGMGQELVELTLQETFRNVMPFERGLELVPADNMVGWQYSMVVISPEPGGAT